MLKPPEWVIKVHCSVLICNMYFNEGCSYSGISIDRMDCTEKKENYCQNVV